MQTRNYTPGELSTLRGPQGRERVEPVYGTNSSGAPSDARWRYFLALTNVGSELIARPDFLRSLKSTFTLGLGLSRRIGNVSKNWIQCFRCTDWGGWVAGSNLKAFFRTASFLFRANPGRGLVGLYMEIV